MMRKDSYKRNILDEKVLGTGSECNEIDLIRKEIG